MGLLRILATLITFVATRIGHPPPDDLSSDAMTLFDFADRTAVQAWRPVNDVVMGGRSSGAMTAGEGCGVFEGRVSFENNGGFASLRAAVEPTDLSAAGGLLLEVRGDGKTYKLGLRTDGRFDGVTWQAPFETRADLAPGEWQTVRLDFADFVPGWRGRMVPDAGAMNVASLRSFGLSISDKQEGPFRLEVRSLSAWPPDSRTDRGMDRGMGAVADILDGGADGPALADALRWKHRIIVIAAPRMPDAQASRQQGRFLAESDGLTDRELLVVMLDGDRVGHVAGRALPARTVYELRDDYNLPTGDWAVVLVGKDGGVKERWDEPVDPDHVFEIIDAMPMRMREMAGEDPADG